MKQNYLYTLVSLLLLLLSACGGSDESTQIADEAHDNTAEVQAYYESNPDFFTFSTVDALPADLNWEDGSQHMQLRCGKHLTDEALRKHIGHIMKFKKKEGLFA